ncbi:MAG TPA: hypothetical protein VK936_01100 [Longimicrobiales bacterium]|nr:hypothetical protein [Longimicrobiales bacterium]
MAEHVDLTALRLDDVGRERLVASILERAEGELARRGAVDVSPMIILSRWMRPALAAAAVLAAVCVSVLAVDRGPAGIGTGLADALAVPQPAYAWLVGERGPTVADVLVAMETEAP